MLKQLPGPDEAKIIQIVLAYIQANPDVMRDLAPENIDKRMNNLKKLVATVTELVVGKT